MFFPVSVRRKCGPWLLWAVVGLGLQACGGGGVPPPAQWPALTISGTVVANGAPMANGQVHVYCDFVGFSARVPDENSARDFFTTTNALGAYSVRVDTATAPCIVEATSADQKTKLYSYVRSLDAPTVALNATANAEASTAVQVTANVNVITDSILAVTLDTANFAPAINSISGTLDSLRTSLAKGEDTAAWASITTQLSAISGPSTKRDIQSLLKPVPVDPVSGPLTVVTGTTVPVGYYSLLQRLSTSNTDSTALQALAQRERFVVVADTNGADVKDLKPNYGFVLIWQRCVLGMVWDGSTCKGEPMYVFYADVAKVVESVPRSTGPNPSQWVLPSSLQLRALLTDKGVISSMNPVWFPNDPGGWTWLAGSPGNNDLGYVYHMKDGVQGVLSKNDKFPTGLSFSSGQSTPPFPSDGKFLVRLFRYERPFR